MIEQHHISGNERKKEVPDCFNCMYDSDCILDHQNGNVECKTIVAYRAKRRAFTRFTGCVKRREKIS